MNLSPRCSLLLLFLLLLTASSCCHSNGGVQESSSSRPPQPADSRFFFGFLPRAMPVPPSGPSRQHNAVGLQATTHG
ncbi:Protein IDA-like 4 [Apostasia shenzhenica]|uniref:Protein IDA-like 4 n=1 Tax=Apostasia shenzhenica TaxID=1088818 RepID=A0A2H9ZUP2_9ASPA|nr:Protein IDA-like 4 [Apostasia shenzhenica]